MNSQQLPRWLSTLSLAIIFCSPISGTLELFAYFAVLQLIFITCSFKTLSNIKVSKQLKSLSKPALHCLILWLLVTNLHLAYILLFKDDNAHRFGALARQIYIAIEIGFCFAIIKQLKVANENFPLKILFAYLSGLATVILIQLFTYSTNLTPISASVWKLSPLLSPNIRDIGTLCAAAASICLGLIYFFPLKEIRHTLLKLITYVLFIVFWAYLIWTGGRTGIASAFISFIILSSFVLILKLQNLKKVILASACIGIAALLSIQVSVYDWHGFSVKRENVQSSETKGNFGNGRKEMWNQAINAVKRAPWFGLGPNGYLFSEERKATGYIQDQPHNIFLQALVEWGIIGSLLFFITVLILLWMFLKVGIEIKDKNSIKAQYYFACLTGLLTLCLHSLTSGTFWNYQPVTLTVILFAILISQLLNTRLDSQNP